MAPAPIVRWRGAGAVDRGGLENRCTLMGTEGSNPSLSAIRHDIQLYLNSPPRVVDGRPFVLQDADVADLAWCARAHLANRPSQATGRGSHDARPRCVAVTPTP